MAAVRGFPGRLPPDTDNRKFLSRSVPALGSIDLTDRG
jgi:hypothetical protein